MNFKNLTISKICNMYNTYIENNNGEPMIFNYSNDNHNKFSIIYNGDEYLTTVGIKFNIKNSIKQYGIGYFKNDEYHNQMIPEIKDKILFLLNEI